MSIMHRRAVSIHRADQRRILWMMGFPVLLLSLFLFGFFTVRATEVIEAGALNSKALSLPVPVYPAPAKQARIAGMVAVDIVIDESGKVESAKSTKGPMMLRQAAVDAARKAKFTPTLKAGTPVKVSGYLQYDFKLE